MPKQPCPFYQVVTHCYTHTQGSSGGAPFPSQIELTLVTTQPPLSLRSTVDKMADQLDLEHLKKISGVCVCDVERLSRVMGEGGEDGEAPGLSQMHEGSSYSQAVTSTPSELGELVGTRSICNWENVC